MSQPFGFDLAFLDHRRDGGTAEPTRVTTAVVSHSSTDDSCSQPRVRSKESQERNDVFDIRLQACRLRLVVHSGRGDLLTVYGKERALGTLREPWRREDAVVRLHRSVL